MKERKVEGERGREKERVGERKGEREGENVQWEHTEGVCGVWVCVCMYSGRERPG